MPAYKVPKVVRPSKEPLAEPGAFKQSGHFLWRSIFGKVQAPVVRKVDSAIHRINLYPLDSAVGFPNTYPLDSDLSSG